MVVKESVFKRTALEILFESVAEKKQVFLKYQPLNSETPSERHIEPLGLFHENEFWYVLGYCHVKNDYLQFRTDRMLEIKRTVLPCTLEHGTMDEHRPKREIVQKIKG